MKKNNSKGFTLLEIMVVLGIITIFVSLALASLKNSRDKGADATVKAQLANALSQAEKFFNDNTLAPQSFANVCTNGLVGGVEGVGKFIEAAAKIAGMPVVNNPSLPAYANDHYYVYTNSTIPVNTTNNFPTTSTSPGPLTIAVCNQNTPSTTINWAAEVPLKSGGYWCVDGTGKSRYSATSAFYNGFARVCN